MKKIELSDMSLINGGDGFADGFCAGVAFAGVASMFIAIVNPFAGMVLAAANVACAEYAFNQL
jgi:hypothetical protein